MERRFIAKEVCNYLFPDLTDQRINSLYVTYLLLRKYKVDVRETDANIYCSEKDAIKLQKENARWLDVDVDLEWNYKGNKHVYTGNAFVDLYISYDLERLCLAIDNRVKYYRHLREMPYLFNANSNEMNLDNLYKILYKYVTNGSEKSPYAQQMQGVYHDQGKLVACNTGTMFVLQCDPVYPAEKEGLILGVKGEIVVINDDMGNLLPYPDYKKIIPANTVEATLILTKNEREDFIEACRTIRASKDATKQVYVRVRDLVIVDPKIIVDIADTFNLLKENFEVIIYTERDKQFKPIVFASEKSTVVTMPFVNTSYVVSVQDALNVGDLL